MQRKLDQLQLDHGLHQHDTLHKEVRPIQDQVTLLKGHLGDIDYWRPGTSDACSQCSALRERLTQCESQLRAREEFRDHIIAALGMRGIAVLDTTIFGEVERLKRAESVR